jgi:S-adenosylmethionine:tRNA ribosyltransferase-isomerase
LNEGAETPLFSFRLALANPKVQRAAMRVSDFDFNLPDELIALRPEADRGKAKLLVVNKKPELQDCRVEQLVDFLRPGDALVVNDTRVIPAQLAATRERLDQLTGEKVRAKIGVNLHQRVAENQWLAFLRPAKKVRDGETLDFGHDLTATVSERDEEGGAKLSFSASGAALDAAIAQTGTIPLPPYIASKRAADDQDLSDYQTSYAQKDGAVAAPTAGLHFTETLLNQIEALGVAVHKVTLHVGAGTFLPVKVEDTKDHKMHSEIGEVSAETAQALNDIRSKGGRIVAVGTTSLRLLETCSDEHGVFHPYADATDIFITPGYSFTGTDVLMTNFHLPKSTLFMLVSAFAGTDKMREAYQHAIAQKYRFYSYGDACLLFPAQG